MLICMVAGAGVVVSCRVGDEVVFGKADIDKDGAKLSKVIFSFAEVLRQLLLSPEKEGGRTGDGRTDRDTELQRQRFGDFSLLSGRDAALGEGPSSLSLTRRCF